MFGAFPSTLIFIIPFDPYTSLSQVVWADGIIFISQKGSGNRRVR